MTNLKNIRRQRRQARVRNAVRGISGRPRLTVFRSNKHLWAQVIDDETGKTLASSSDLSIGSELKKKDAKGLKIWELVGEAVAKNALKNKIDSVRFDRGWYKYHGIIKAFAEGARKGGLKF